MDIGGQFLQLIVLIVLANLLGPTAFGLVGITLLTLATLEEFTRPGFNEAMIHNVGDEVERYLNTTWTVQLARGGAIAAVLYVGAPYVAAFFSEPRAIELIRVMALIPLLKSVANPAIVYFEKDLDFHKQFLLNMGSSVLQFVVSLGIALVEPSVWALVIGHISYSVGRAGGSYLLMDYRPRLAFDRATFDEMFGFGKWITASSIVSFLLANGDDFVIGRLLPTASLGLYQYGYRLGKYTSREITSIIAEVMFPAYSKIQDDVQALREAFYHTLIINSVIVFPMAIGGIVVAPLFVRGFLGAQWVDSIPVFQVISVFGMLTAFTARGDVVQKAIGRPDFRFKMRLLWLVATAILIVPLTTRFGITGTALAVVSAYLLTEVPATIYFTVSHLETTYARYFRTISYPLAASLTMGLVTVVARDRLTALSPFFEFFVIVGLGFVVYVVATLVLDTLFDSTIEDTYSILLNAMRG